MSRDDLRSIRSLLTQLLVPSKAKQADASSPQDFLQAELQLPSCLQRSSYNSKGRALRELIQQVQEPGKLHS